MTDIVLMEGRGFGFVTFRDQLNAHKFLEVRAQKPLLSSWPVDVPRILAQDKGTPHLPPRIVSLYIPHSSSQRGAQP